MPWSRSHMARARRTGSARPMSDSRTNRKSFPYACPFTTEIGTALDLAEREQVPSKPAHQRCRHCVEQPDKTRVVERSFQPAMEACLHRKALGDDADPGES